MRARLTVGAVGTVLAVGVAMAPGAAAIETFDPCSPSFYSAAAENSNRQAGPAGYTSGVWLYYPAHDAFRPGSVGQQLDLNGDGWICAWTPYGKFEPTSLSPLLVMDNNIPQYQP